MFKKPKPNYAALARTERLRRRREAATREYGTVQRVREAREEGRRRGLAAAAPLQAPDGIVNHIFQQMARDASISIVKDTDTVEFRHAVETVARFLEKTIEPWRPSSDAVAMVQHIIEQRELEFSLRIPATEWRHRESEDALRHYGRYYNARP
jgi:hypothetical protein